MTTTYVSEGDEATPANMNTWLNSASSEVFNVKASAYGAVGDGSTDDTTAIQAALDAAVAARGTVIFPAGTYIISAPLTVDNSAVRILGTAAMIRIGNIEMSGAVLKAASAFSGSYMMTVENTVEAEERITGFEIGFLGFDGNSVASLGGLHGVAWYDACYAHDITFANFTGSFVHIEPSASQRNQGFALERLWGIHRDEGTSASVLIEGANEFSLRDCKFFGNGDPTSGTSNRNGLEIASSGSWLSRRALIEGCSFANYTLAGIHLQERCDFVSIINNTFELLGNGVIVGETAGSGDHCRGTLLLNNRYTTNDAVEIILRRSIGTQVMEPYQSTATDLQIDSGSSNDFVLLNITSGQWTVTDNGSTTNKLFHNGGLAGGFTNNVPVVATASLPAAGASMDGTVLIENAGAGDRNVILYAEAQRFRIDGGTAF